MRVGEVASMPHDRVIRGLAASQVGEALAELARYEEALGVYRRGLTVREARAAGVAIPRRLRRPIPPTPASSEGCCVASKSSLALSLRVLGFSEISLLC